MQAQHDNEFFTVLSRFIFYCAIASVVWQSFFWCELEISLAELIAYAISASSFLLGMTLVVF